MDEVPGKLPSQGPRTRQRRWRHVVAAALGLVLLAGLEKAWHDTLDDPLVRRESLPMPGLSPEAGPLRLLLMSDLHVAAPDMPPDRLARIVTQMNALHPDMVLITGDFISDRKLATRHYTYDEALAPLAGLRPRWGTVAVLGNHDYARDPVAARAALLRRGIHVLTNEAIRLGPLTLGGLGDLGSEDAKLSATVNAMRHLGPPYVLLAHEPDKFNDLAGDVSLMLAGHTHCGQVVPPFLGPVVTGSSFGQRYACGIVGEHNAHLVVTAGLGTSDLPIRFGAHTDVWLLTLTPAPLELTTAQSPPD
jgi:predicted MPP superfamily phosphohydrolase